MKLKLDENIGNRGAELLRLAGHDVATVRDEKLVGTTDEHLYDVCATEKLALVTLDHDFGRGRAGSGPTRAGVYPGPIRASLRRR